jgi:Tfp pilus assembly protein PilF
MDVFRDWNKAARHLELAIRYPQGYETAPETYERLGFCYYYLDDVARAKSVWSRGSRKFPEYEPLKTNLQMLEY